MTAALPIPVRDDWTAEDLLDLPDNCWYEITDGVLSMSLSPTPGHQLLTTGLVNALRQFLPEGWYITAHLDVVLTSDKRNVRCPDVVVYKRDDPDKMVHADRVALVVEVVSPSTKTQDRVTLTEHGKYYEHSPRAGVFKVDKPWPIEIDLDAVAHDAGLGEH